MRRCRPAISRTGPGRATALAGLLVLGLAACSEEEAAAPPPPPEVVVQVVKAGPVPSVVELPGRLQAVRTAEVRARVDGIVERRLYEEGTDVAEGTVLFQIDPRPLRARLDAARAALRRAEAEATNARRDVERFRPLVARNAISKQEFDAAEARLAQAEADVGSAQAQVEQARLDLGYATVTAPISGRAGRAQVTEGALVSAAEGTLLTTIEQLHPIYVNFSQSSGKILQIRQAMESGRLVTPELERMQVTLILEGGNVYGKTGHINFLDMAVDPGTGTVSLRAIVPNEQRFLLPGEFVRARVAVGTDPDGIAIPQKAVRLSAETATVLVVGPKNVVAERQVRLGDLLGDRWVIEEGLKPGERIITDGLLQVQPGMQVRIAQAGQAQSGQGAAATPTPANAAPQPQGQTQGQAEEQPRGEKAAPVKQ